MATVQTRLQRYSPGLFLLTKGMLSKRPRIRDEDIGKKVVLSVQDIHLRFGALEALDGVSVDVKEGEILAIIGPNGAGKTCLLNVISGFYRPQEGMVCFEGKDITRLSSHEIAVLGLCRTFQNLAVYSELSVVDNIIAGRHPHIRYNWLCGIFQSGPVGREEVEHRAIAEDIVDFLELDAVRNKVVGSLPYGLRKRVELGRALALEPRILLLDEPMAGMNLEEKEDITRFILDVGEFLRIPIVFIEHDMGVVMDIADRVAVLDFGRGIAVGTPEEIKVEPRVITAYLGGGE